MYYLNLLLILGLGILLCEVKPSRHKTAIYLALCMFIMALFFTFRYGMGFDFYSYRRIFDSIASISNLSEFFASSYIKSYPMYAIFNYLVSFFTHSYTVFNAVTSILLFSLVGFAIYKNSPICWISVFCYVTLLYFYISMNFVRQSIALAIILLAYPFLKKKKIIPFFLLVLLASMVHVYALILIPAYFFLILKPNRTTYGIIGGIWLVLFVLSENILNAIAKVAPIYHNTVYLSSGNSIRIVFVSVVCFIVILAFSKLLVQKDSSNYILVNLSFYGMLFSLMSLRHSILDRFSYYFLVYLIFAFAEIAQCLRPCDTFVQATAKATSKKELKAQWFNYRWYVCSLILVLLINHSSAEVRNAHRVFPYHSIFNEKWRKQVDYIYYEIGNGGWLLREISPEELPEELR